MAKSSPKPIDVEAEVERALLAIAAAESPLKLVGKGGVFATAKAAPEEVVRRLKDEIQPLVVETGSGKAASVALTTSGFERIASRLPSDQFARAAVAIADALPAPRRVIFLQSLVSRAPQAVAALEPLLSAAVAAEKAEAETRAREAEAQRQAERAAREALERWVALLEQRRAERIEMLRRELIAEGERNIDVPQPGVAKSIAQPSPKPPAEEKSHPRPLTFPREEEDIGFRRNVARRLVSAWVDAWEAKKPDAREFLEAAIWNVSGFRPIGEAGQALSFDGTYHEGGPGLFTGDRARVERPGWVLDEADEREYVVLKARVAKL